MAESQFNNVSLVGRGGSNPGQLKVHSGGVLWKKQGCGKAVEGHKSDTRTNQLSVRTKDGLKYKFTGFHNQEKEVLLTLLNPRVCCLYVKYLSGVQCIIRSVKYESDLKESNLYDDTKSWANVDDFQWL